MQFSGKTTMNVKIEDAGTIGFSIVVLVNNIKQNLIGQEIAEDEAI